MTTDFEAVNAPKNKTVFAPNNYFEIQKSTCICVLGWAWQPGFLFASLLENQTRVRVSG